MRAALDRRQRETIGFLLPDVGKWELKYARGNYVDMEESQELDSEISTKATKESKTQSR